MSFSEIHLEHVKAQDGTPSITIANSTGVVTGKVVEIGMTGEVRMWAGTTAPDGWHLCDGTEFNRTNEAALFGVIGTNYGSGNGTTTFNIPDFRGRTPVGPDNGQNRVLSDNTLGDSSGEETHTLTANETPLHNHTITGTQGISEANHAHSYTLANVGQGAGAGGSSFETGTQYSTSTGGAGGWSKTIDFSNASLTDYGGGQDHNNMQPYLVINYIIKL